MGKRFFCIHFFKNFDITKSVIFQFSLIVFIICGIVLIRTVIVDPLQSNNDMDEIQKIVYNENLDSDDINSVEAREKRVSGLSNLNPDIKGWIKIENTPIDYPVLQNKSDPAYYLHKNYKKEGSRYGSIFIDASCDLEKGCKNILIHGHSMNNGTMFRALINFTELDFYESTPTFVFDMPGKLGNWKIISVFRTNTREDQGPVFNYLKPNFASDYDFLNYVYQVKVRSLIDIPVDVNENDELITLSTCSYEMDDFRTVVVGRKVRDGESADVDAIKARWANSPVLPEVYYSVYGTPKPNNITNFNEALKNGKITWYNGTQS